MRTLAVFPTDPLYVSVRKGEVKARYFNPESYFEKVVVINISDRELTLDEFAKAKAMAGDAEMVVKTIIVKSTTYMLTHLALMKRRIYGILSEMRPDCIRAYGCMFEGYFASYCSRKLDVPFVLSLHANFEEMRQLYWRGHKYARLLFYILWSPLEQRTLHSADEIIAVYGYEANYAIRQGIQRKLVHLIHNKVDENIFYPPKNISKKYMELISKVKEGKPINVITVQRMEFYKNQKCLIRAIVGLEGKYRLLFIGRGPMLQYNMNLAKELGVDRYVTFIPSVANKDLAKYYQKADLFATALQTGGIGIPEIEAMGCGLPVIHGKYPDEPHPEILSEVAMMIDNNPESYRKLFMQIYSNPKILARQSAASIKMFHRIKGSIMERKEREVYQKLLGRKTK